MGPKKGSVFWSSPKVKGNRRSRRRPGAYFVGAYDLMEHFKPGWMDFDCAISTPDLMASVVSWANCGPLRGLILPNP